MRATGNRASLKVAQAFSQRNRWKKCVICQQQNKGIQLHIPDNLRLLRQLRVAVASGQDSNLARFQALRTGYISFSPSGIKTSASPMLTHMRDCGARSRSFLRVPARSRSSEKD